MIDSCFNPLFDCISLAYAENDREKQTFINLFEILAQHVNDAIKARMAEIETLTGKIVLNVDENTRGRSKVLGVMIGKEVTA